MCILTLSSELIGKEKAQIKEVKIFIRKTPDEFEEEVLKDEEILRRFLESKNVTPQVRRGIFTDNTEIHNIVLYHKSEQRSMILAILEIHSFFSGDITSV